MTDEEIQCFCDRCPIRFKCFTQERVYTDPLYQALYETYVAEGKSHDEALKHVKSFVEIALVKKASQNVQPPSQPVNKKWIDEYREFKKPYWGDRVIDTSKQYYGSEQYVKY